MTTKRNPQHIIDIWDREQDRLNRLEDGIDNALEHLIKYRPANYRNRLTDDDLLLANRTYIGFIKMGAAIRTTLREMRSVKVRFPGQTLDTEGAAHLLYTASDELINKIYQFTKTYKP